MIINDVDMPNFTGREFSEDPVYADKKLLESIQAYRTKLQEAFYLSPVSGALARFGGRLTSQHRIIRDPITGTVTKFSTAIDGFPGGNPFKAFIIAQNSGLFNGVGVYFDTKRNGIDQVMLHLDLREKPLIWYRNDHEYHYPKGPDTEFYKNLLHLFYIAEGL